MAGEMVAGDWFGERALITNEPRAATCISVGETQCLVIYREDFTNVISRYMHFLFVATFDAKLLKNFCSMEELTGEGALDDLNNLEDSVEIASLRNHTSKFRQLVETTRKSTNSADRAQLRRRCKALLEMCR
jgi:CRP-like cAMP-binding protein